MENSINEFIDISSKFCRMIQMKKLLIICILIVSMIFISGCTSEGNTETPMSSQNTQESNIQLTDSILKSSDVSGYDSYSHSLYSTPKNTLYVPFEWKPTNFHHHYGADSYANLPIGHRNVGEELRVGDQSGKILYISVVKFDSDPDSFLIRWLDSPMKVYEQISADQLEARGISISDPNIGDYSHMISSINPNTDVQTTEIRFIRGTTFVFVAVLDEKGISEKTAIRIAKIIEGRLD